MPGKQPKTPKPKKIEHNKRVTSEDMPGSGMAKKAAKAIEQNRKRRKEMLKDL